jgi:hypothetical protein
MMGETRSVHVEPRFTQIFVKKKTSVGEATSIPRHTLDDNIKTRIFRLRSL